MLTDDEIAVLKIAINSTDPRSRHVATLRALVERARREGWQGIESAPKDGRVLLWLPDCEYGRATVTVGNMGDPERRVRHPTHWQPLPTPPNDAKGDV